MYEKPWKHRKKLHHWAEIAFNEKIMVFGVSLMKENGFSSICVINGGKTFLVTVNSLDCRVKLKAHFPFYLQEQIT